jgi:hypothetical protein
MLITDKDPNRSALTALGFTNGWCDLRKMVPWHTRKGAIPWLVGTRDTNKLSFILR